MASVNIHCPRCQSAQVYRHGQNPKGHDRFRCRDCHRVFQLTYTYEARKPGNTGSGTRITPKQGGYWPTLLVPVPMKPAGNYWHCLRHSTSA
ncbi:iso-IS1 ORF1 [Shigella dysenteriae]|uniref:Iso-IS1 ORF1 n=1 Tax=Shigella dysenteriae TaxID=622 RepID=A0A2X2JDB6_SHIDY|nr:iso-IS1 ORF1 [Shigella dysenteriae]